MDSQTYDTLDGVLATDHDMNTSLPGGRLVRVQFDYKFYWIENRVADIPADEVDPRVLTIGDTRRRPPKEVLEYLSQEYGGVFEIDEERHHRRIPTWVRLIHDEDHIQRVHTDTLQAEIDDVRFPLSVGRDGRAAMFAYLAAHGFQNSTIAEAFGVQSSTVRVNLSRYKSK